jgi:drug/metabolite transporter (DMT)-like permease
LSHYVFPVLTGIFFGLQGSYSKALTGRMPPLLLTWGMFAFTVPYLLFLLVIEGVPVVDWREFGWALGVSALGNLLAWYLFFRAIKESALAHTMPFTAFTPVFLIPVAYVLFAEMPDRSGALGIALIVAGAYGIHLRSNRFLEPFRMLYQNRGTRLMLVTALIWSVTATVDKAAVLASSQAFYGFSIDLILAILYVPYLLKHREMNGRLVKENLGGLLLLGLITGLLTIFQFTALKHVFVSYVIAFKRSGVLVSVILGALLFGEGDLGKNLVCTALMVVGMFLL